MSQSATTDELQFLIGALRRRTALIIGIMVAVFAVTVAATLKIPKLYRAEALVKAENVAVEEAALGAVLPRTMTQSSGGGEDRSRIPTEVYAMTAPPVIDSLIQKLQLKNSHGRLRHTIRTDGTYIPLVPFPSGARGWLSNRLSFPTSRRGRSRTCTGTS